MNIASFWAKLRSRERHPKTALQLAPHGFTLSDGERTMMIAWADITEVVAFKRDLMTVDLMCTTISTATTMVEIDEEMSGYESFDEALHEALGISISWKLDVMFPAFETKPTRIFPGPACSLQDASVP